MKKGTYVFSVCKSSNAHAQSPIGTTDMHFLPEAQGPYYICGQQTLLQENTLARLFLSLEPSCSKLTMLVVNVSLKKL